MPSSRNWAIVIRALMVSLQRSRSRRRCEISKPDAKSPAVDGLAYLLLLIELHSRTGKMCQEILPRMMDRHIENVSLGLSIRLIWIIVKETNSSIFQVNLSKEPKENVGQGRAPPSPRPAP